MRFLTLRNCRRPHTASASMAFVHSLASRAYSVPSHGASSIFERAKAALQAAEKVLHPTRMPSCWTIKSSSRWMRTARISRLLPNDPRPLTDPAQAVLRIFPRVVVLAAGQASLRTRV